MIQFVGGYRIKGRREVRQLPMKGVQEAERWHLIENAGELCLRDRASGLAAAAATTSPVTTLIADASATTGLGAAAAGTAAAAAVTTASAAAATDTAAATTAAATTTAAAAARAAISGPSGGFEDGRRDTRWRRRRVRAQLQ